METGDSYNNFHLIITGCCCTLPDMEAMLDHLGRIGYYNTLKRHSPCKKGLTLVSAILMYSPVQRLSNMGHMSAGWRLSIAQ